LVLKKYTSPAAIFPAERVTPLANKCEVCVWRSELFGQLQPCNSSLSGSKCYYLCVPQIKTRKTDAPFADFLDSIPHEQIRKDCRAIAEMMQTATKAEPKMWGSSIIGFGHCRLVYPNGKEMDWMQIAFSPRKANITLYLTEKVLKSDLMRKLGKNSCGKGCLYIKNLADVDVPTLKKLIRETVRQRRDAAS
jgi:hypothetical protein